jgi:hypothetical protein
VVFLNGVALDSTDYTASNGTSIVLGTAAALNDELVIIAFKSFTVADTYTKGEVDGFAVKLTGNQTVAGTKTFSSEISAPNTFGFKNRLINGLMAVDQRNNGAAQTITAGANTYTVDRWFVVASGANVTGQRVAGSGNNQYNYRLTGAASVTGISFIQRIESNNCYDLAGQTATFSINLANSVLTTVNYQIAYAGATDNWALATTLITSGTFTVSSTLTNFTLQISIPAAATTGLQILVNVGAQTSGTWTIGQAQLEKGSTATSFDYRPYGTELSLCQRYYYKVGPSLGNDVNLAFNGFASSTTIALLTVPFPVTMRTSPSALEQSGTAADYAVRYAGGSIANCSAVPSFQSGQTFGAQVGLTVASGLTAGGAIGGRSGSATGNNSYFGWSAEL